MTAHVKRTESFDCNLLIKLKQSLLHLLLLVSPLRIAKFQIPAKDLDDPSLRNFLRNLRSLFNRIRFSLRWSFPWTIPWNRSEWKNRSRLMDASIFSRRSLPLFLKWIEPSLGRFGAENLIHTSFLGSIHRNSQPTEHVERADGERK